MCASSQSRRGSPVLAGDDLDRVAAAQLVVERHDAAVRPCAPRQRWPTRCARGRRNPAASRPRQVDHLALRAQHVHAVLDQLGLQAGEQPARRPSRCDGSSSRRSQTIFRSKLASALRRLPCIASAPPRRARPGRASRACGSALRASCPGRSRPCAASGSCCPWAWRCSRRTRRERTATGRARTPSAA